LTSDGRALARTSKNAIDALGMIDLKSGRYQAFDLPFVAFSEVQLRDDAHAVALAQASNDTGVLIEIALASGAWRVLHQPTQNTLPLSAQGFGTLIKRPVGQAYGRRLNEGCHF